MALMNVVTYLNGLPNIVWAHGSYVFDEDNNKWLDWFNDSGVCSLGYHTMSIGRDVSHFEGHSPMPHRLPQIFPNETRTRCAQMWD